MTAALTGQSLSAAHGSVAAANDVATTGQASTAAAGSVAAQTSKAITGQAGSLAQGTTAPATDQALTGASLTANQGTVTVASSDVTAALTGKYGIPAAAVIPVGVGMAAPVAPNTDDAGRAKNRRVEIVAM